MDTLPLATIEIVFKRTKPTYRTWRAECFVPGYAIGRPARAGEKRLDSSNAQLVRVAGCSVPPTESPVVDGPLFEIEVEVRSNHRLGQSANGFLSNAMAVNTAEPNLL